MHISSGRWLYGLSLSLVTTLLWGVLPIQLKLVLQSMDPVTVTWYRLFSSGLLLFAWLAASRRLPALRPLGRGGRGLLLLAIGGLAANYVLYMFGLERLSAATTQLIIQVAPILLLLASLLVFRESFGLGQCVGLLVLLLGFGLFFNQRLDELFGSLGSYTLGVLTILASALAWVFYGLAQKQLLTLWSSAQIMMAIYLACAALLTPWARPAQLFELSALQAWLLLACCLNTLVAYGAFAEALAHWEASRVSAALALTPLVTLGSVALAAALWPALIAAEDLNVLAYAGALLVAAGSSLVALAPTLLQRRRGR
ncbi:DMT family transporter [Pseudomonas sp. MAP12]|uniref:DMT family transporter n=1 Tax=Geopseudomonas aromaticivorans TaxID=2849492 RepID=A0ABS6MRQ5_9GAMM|nr:DMT family transporter [Pseudomonas aromaticivorans]MBV2131480.1 DMT family transporter [Pseudomonas aromaticivorans]